MHLLMQECYPVPAKIWPSFPPFDRFVIATVTRGLTLKLSGENAQPPSSGVHIFFAAGVQR
jgi:hypothetical protein